MNFSLAEVSVGFDPTSYIVPEGDVANLTIVRIGDAEEPVVVTINTNDGTAEGMLTFCFTLDL